MKFLSPDNFKHHIDHFNTMEPEAVVNLIPNSQSWDWIKMNVPFFSCPDADFEEIYFFRWWCYRKHIKQTDAGKIVTEFITDVSHGGAFNSISCALGHHLAEGRWLRQQEFLDEYTRFWFRGDNGKRMPKFHQYSQWAHAAMFDRSMVTGDRTLVLELFDDLVADYEAWEDERQRDDGLFWQFDVRDGMEESISGSRRAKNARPTINSYMYANAMTLAAIATLKSDTALARKFVEKATALKKLVQEHLWDSQARFFKAQTEENGLCDAREEIGFIPWTFNLPDAGYEEAWKQLIDPQGFWAPFGITTAERRSPKFRSHGVGKCEWDGAVWPFATSQTLDALANVLRNYNQTFVTREHYFEAMQAYVHCQHMNGKPYIGEYLDEVNGEWLKGDNPRSRYYNHSTFADLVIGGLVGIVPGANETITLKPLVPETVWDWFCLQDVRYHGRDVTVVWDRDGKKFGERSGLSVYVDEKLAAHSADLSRAVAVL